MRETYERTGASVMGKRMFEAGEQMWPEEAPFHTPVFLVTHEKRESAGDRDVGITGGGETILEYVNAALSDDFAIAFSPVLFGSGIRIFEGVDAVRSESTQRATHLTHAVRER